MEKAKQLSKGAKTVRRALVRGTPRKVARRRRGIPRGAKRRGRR